MADATPLGAFAALDEDALRLLLSAFLSSADVLRLAACRCARTPRVARVSRAGAPLAPTDARAVPRRAGARSSALRAAAADPCVWAALSAREHAAVAPLLQPASPAGMDVGAARARFAVGRQLTELRCTAWREAAPLPSCRVRVPPPREGSAAAVLGGATRKACTQARARGMRDSQAAGARRACELRRA